MALLFMDSFDHYLNHLQKWVDLSGASGTDTSGIAAGVGRRGTGGFRIRHANPNFIAYSNALKRTFVSSGNTVVVGFAFNSVTGLGANYNQGNFPENNTSRILCIRRNNFSHVFFMVNSNGTITAARRNTSNDATALGTTNAALVQGQYFHLEFRLVIDNTVGSVAIRFNGNEVLNVQNVDTQGSEAGGPTWDELWLGPMGASAPVASPCEWRYDDLYVLDGSGPNPFNNFIGDCRVDTRLPQAEGASSTWTPLTGTNNATMVGDTQADDDASYVSASAAGQKDTYIVQDVAVPGATIYGVQLSALIKKTDAGVCKISSIVRHGGVEYPTPLPDPGTDYAFKSVPMSVNPAHGGVWTETEFNQAEFGFTRTQ